MKLESPVACSLCALTHIAPLLKQGPHFSSFGILPVSFQAQFKGYLRVNVSSMTRKRKWARPPLWLVIQTTHLVLYPSLIPILSFWSLLEPEAIFLCLQPACGAPSAKLTVTAKVVE